MTEWGDAGALAGNIPPNQRAAAVYQNPARAQKTREGGGSTVRCQKHLIYLYLISQIVYY